MTSRVLNHKGFTLIELLVVIAIIGLLASVVLISLNSARQKARVAKRVADLNQIAKALELYYNDNNAYPAVGGWRSQCSGWTVVTANNVIPGLVPTYISSFPTDPSMVSASNQNCYLYYSNGMDYKFMDYVLSDMTLSQINQFPTLKDPTRNDFGNVCGWVDGNLTLAVFSSSGKCW